MIFLGADHRGFKIKNEILEYLIENFKDTFDCGNLNFDPNDDYPDFAFLVGEKVASNLDINKGILICGSGEGMAIAANKVKGIRATLCNTVISSHLSREHNNANVLVLDSEVSFENAIDILNEFIKTEFSSDIRHHRRVEKIIKYEEYEVSADS